MKNTKTAFCILLMICLAGTKLTIQAQVYRNLVEYSYNGVPTHGVKIKTNIPFMHQVDMPTVKIQGYNYGNGEVMDLTLVFYIFNNDANLPKVWASSVSTAGSYTPRIFLAQENGKVVIFIDDKNYFLRFFVDAFTHGFNNAPAYYKSWATADEALSSNEIVQLEYRNSFNGNVRFPENGVWNTNGNVGIGTTTPTERLSVNGNIRAREIKVETNNWPDYVFEEDYKLTPLAEVETFIKANKHLPEVPSAREIEEDGLSLGEMNKLMMKKIEELTLHLIEKDRQLQQQNTSQQTLLQDVNMLKERVSQQANEISQLKTKRK
ncbi:hypothetical protein U0038_06445 [Sphingobacterium spiritivorum]|uniref:Uncharacterized protein n=1 Tax=Sphingobacterium spiritivorum ATCC 33861 TaxID=525373 RepID=D7VJW8_SPHSI|nr:hypothetical protein [Sphingobacterium spiritivorum]EFK58570.1 hypothetical protein HMPREF0766_11287 [Sphingobacterium spiritivorum ATCC 33861]WQD35383.1 hypothetical protein U0038_06445 [Sphingobacterium spiritivorum]SUJ00241.1 Uncharacterised protein [Sphingobacterium spiritivorum]